MSVTRTTVSTIAVAIPDTASVYVELHVKSMSPAEADSFADLLRRAAQSVRERMEDEK